MTLLAAGQCSAQASDVADLMTGGLERRIRPQEQWSKPGRSGEFRLNTERSHGFWPDKAATRDSATHYNDNTYGESVD
jgi:hypothetical protein